MKDHGNLPPVQWIADPRSLGELVELLRDQNQVAVDTEADSMFNYREKVCLIQLSTKELDFLVDPLADMDLDPLAELFEDPQRTKIFHDSEYDLSLLRRCLQFEVRGLFDTSLAAQALGEAEVGLSSVLKREFDIELDKRAQLSDWSRRPLSSEQMKYARLDTRFLIPLKERLSARLAQAGLRHVHDGEIRRLENMASVERRFNPDEYVRLKGARNLSLSEQSLLRELFIERDRLAAEHNVPPFKILAHECLVAIAARAPASHAELARLPGMSPKIARRFGDYLLDAVERGRAKGPLTQMPRMPSKDGTDGLDEAGLELFERLKLLRNRLAKQAGFGASLVLNRHVLPRLAELRPKTLAELEPIEGLLPWQCEQFGLPILAELQAFQADLEAGRIAPRSRGRRRR